MQKAVDFLREQTKGIRGATISTGLVGSIKVDNVPIAHSSSILKKDSQVIITIYDVGAVNPASVVKAICAAGLYAYVFSKTTVVVSAPRYGDKDKVLRHIGKCGEEAKVAIRNIRKALKKQGVDEAELQKETDKYIQEVDDLCRVIKDRI